MEEEMKTKPDYTDSDWTWLIRDRTAKWQTMLNEIKDLGWRTVELREDMGYTSKLILLPVHPGRKRGMVIVCAGGGFMFKSSNEAKPVAEFFHSVGMNTAILDYHVDPTIPFGQSMDIRISAGYDGLAAVRYLRANADVLGILPDKIAIGGFSAGGMISSFTATQFDYGHPQSGNPLLSVSSRPDAALILYGAMSHSGLAGIVGEYDCKLQAELCRYDSIRNIRSDCPPMFVFQTHKDDPRHALQFCYELACRGVPYEIHTFEDGPHGGALYDGKCEDSPQFKHTARWADLAAEWLEEKGF